jgi:hypothetical protein
VKTITVLCLIALSACSTVRVPDVIYESTAPSPVESKLFVTYDPASTIEKSFAQPALDLMNKCYSSGKLKELWLKHKFKSFNTVFDISPKNNLDAYNEYVKGAPYALTLLWYRTKNPYSSVVGYTYNFANNDWGSTKSETRIYSNSRIVGSYGPKDLSAHWAHELSHQVRAGGYVHYTIFDGSAPYEAGNIMEECVQ